MKTFNDLFRFIQNATKDEAKSLQIYSNKRQVNILDKDELSIMNILFTDDEVHIYNCHRPGYADYGRFTAYSLEEPIQKVALHCNGQQALAVLASI